MVYIDKNIDIHLPTSSCLLYTSIFLLFFNLWIGLAALAVIGIVLLIARGMKKEALQDSKDRQEQNENLTEAVLDLSLIHI